MDVSELDKAIDELGKLETNHGTGDPAAFAALQSQAIESLKSFEFSLYRKLALSGDKSPTLGARTPVPEDYRAAVEEYYRQLAAPGKKKQ
jgi:hypothetical protein